MIRFATCDNPPMPPIQNQDINKLAVARNFSRAAETYDKVSVLPTEIGKRLLERLEFIKISPTVVLDLGGGTGFITQVLGEQYPTAQILNLDIAENMLRVAKKSALSNSNHSWLSADAEHLPIKNQSVDFVFSNCTLHWIPNFLKVFQEVNRILKPNGLLLFSTFGPDTLKELRSSFAKLDKNQHVNHFVDMHHIGDALLKTGFSDPVMDMEMISLTYKNVQGLIRDIKHAGANTVHSKIPRGLSPKNLLDSLEKSYEIFRNQAGLLPATFEVLFGHAWSFGIPILDQSVTKETCALPLADPKPHVNKKPN